MIVGFTGTRHGMTLFQLRQARAFLQQLKPSEAHHGDCVGADKEFHTLCLSLDIPVILHPPTNDHQRAFCKHAKEERPRKTYLVRNKEIVDECDVLLAAPQKEDEMLRSGTWSTVRYARKNIRREGQAPVIIYVLHPQEKVDEQV